MVINPPKPPTGPDGEPIAPGDIVEAGDARYVKKAGDTMTGNLTMGTAHTFPTPWRTIRTHSSCLRRHLHKMGLMPAGMAWKVKLDSMHPRFRLNVFTGQSMSIMSSLRVGRGGEVKINKTGVSNHQRRGDALGDPIQPLVAAGHAVYVEGQNIDERYLLSTGGKVTGELEVEAKPAHPTVMAMVDTYKRSNVKITGYRDLDERYPGTLLTATDAGNATWMAPCAATTSDVIGSRDCWRCKVGVSGC